MANENYEPIEYQAGFPLFIKNENAVKIDNNRLYISDIWSFWDFYLKNLSNKYLKSDKQFLLSLLEQAKYFFQAAESAPLKSKSLLYYYSFLNLSKIIININNLLGEEYNYHHGISNNIDMLDRTAKKSILEISTITLKELHPHNNKLCNIAPTLLNIFNPNFYEKDKNKKEPITLNIHKLLRYCVGIHKTYTEVYSNQRSEDKINDFVRITDHTLFSSKDEKRGRCLGFKATLDNPTDKDLSDLIEAGYSINGRELVIKQKITNNPFYATKLEHINLSKEIKKQGVWSIIDGSKNILYLSKNMDKENRFSQESIIYLIMFYLGSITRYKPHLFDELFEAKDGWIISEFLETQPKQFLYLATSHAVGKEIYSTKYSI